MPDLIAVKRPRENIWKRLTRLFRSGPVIRHKIAAGEKMYEPQGTASAYKRELSSLYVNSLASYGQYERLCVSIESLISSPGVERGHTLRELIEKYPNGEKFVVYAYDHEKCKIVPAWAHHPRSSGFRETVSVKLDNGDELICTPDHPFMLRDGSYRDAGDLREGDSLMPFYRRYFGGTANDGKKFDGYASIYTMEKQPKSWKGWEPEHKLIAEWYYGRDVEKGEHVHHIDHDPKNNDPLNLEIIDAKKHLSEHGKQAKDQWTDSEKRERIQTAIQRAWDEDDGSRRESVARSNRKNKTRQDVTFEKIIKSSLKNNHRLELVCKDLNCSSSVLYRIIKECGYNTEKGWNRFVKLYFGVEKEQNYSSFANYWNGKKRSQEWKDSRKKEGNVNWRNDLTIMRIEKAARENSFVSTKTCAALKCQNKILLDRIRRAGYSGWRDFVSSIDRNHTVVSVEPNGIVEVGDLTVDGYENFMIGASPDNGVFVHNSRYADYCVVGDTFVLTSEGPIKISEIVEKFSNGERAYVYAFDNENFVTRLIEISNAKLTGFEKIWRVELSSGFVIECNATHPFMTADGEYIRTKDLKEGTLLVPETIENQEQVVVSVKLTDVMKNVYDITVPALHNFAICDENCNNIIYLRNSEMEFTPELSSALDIYSDEVTADDEEGNVLAISSKNDELKQILETLFFDILNIEFNIWSWVRNLCKYGDFVLFVDASEENGILNLLPIPINEIEREEGYDKDDPFAVRFRWLTQGNKVLQNWQVIHFRLLGNDSFLPYGASMIEPARRIWRQLILIEDAMLVYRIVRSPERRVFKIDVGGIPPGDIDTFMNEVKNKLRRNQIVDKDTGRVDLRYNPLSVDEDYFIPVRGDRSSNIETLAGGQFTGDIDDVQYIQNKLFAALKIPKAYLGYEDDIGSKATLAQQDVRFARTIGRIQKIILAELNKIAIIHLFLLGYEGEDLVDFELNLANSSSIAEQQKLELWRMRFEIASTATEGMLDRDTVYKKIFKLSDDEIQKIKDGKRIDKLEDLTLESMTLEGVQGGAEAENIPGEEELPSTLGGPPGGSPEAPEQQNQPPPETASIDRGDVLTMGEKENRGSTGNDASHFAGKGKDLFAPDEDLSSHVFGTKKQTASDPSDKRYLRRLVTKPLSDSDSRDDDEDLNNMVERMSKIDNEISEKLQQFFKN